MVARSNEANRTTRKLKSLLQVFLPIRGLAILIVVAAHSAIALIAGQVSADPIGSLTPALLGIWQIAAPGKTAILELARCAVPLFIFLAGYHMARSPRSLRAIWNNSKKLLVPMSFWSLVAWAISWRAGTDGWSVGMFLKLLLSGRAQLGYFFIILIVQYFVLSRWLVPAMKNKPSVVLMYAVLVQLIVHAYDYLYLLGDLRVIEAAEWIRRLGPFPEYLFPRFIVSFSIGIWASLNTDQFKRITEKHILTLAVLAAISVSLLFLEYGLVFRRSYFVLGSTVFEATSRAWGEWKVSTAVWSIVAIFFILGMCRRWLPLRKLLEELGKNSYQILLLHGMVLFFIFWVRCRFIFGAYWFGPLGFVVRLSAGLYLPLLAVRAIRKWAPPAIRTIMLGS